MEREKVRLSERMVKIYISIEGGIFLSLDIACGGSLRKVVGAHWCAGYLQMYCIWQSSRNLGRLRLLSAYE